MNTSDVFFNPHHGDIEMCFLGETLAQRCQNAEGPKVISYLAMSGGEGLTSLTSSKQDFQFSK